MRTARQCFNVLIMQVLLVSCSMPSFLPAATLPSTPATNLISSPTIATSPAVNLARTPAPSATAPAEPVYTHIVIDGDPSDWQDIPPSFQDARGDNQGGGFDVSAVYLFYNDRYLYVMAESNGEAYDFVQVDLTIQAGSKRYNVNFRPPDGCPANIGDVSSGTFKPLGTVPGSLCEFGKVMEFKMPLKALGGALPDTLEVRPMGGAGGQDWYGIDDTGPIFVHKLAELEPAAASSLPRVCGEPIASPAPFGSLPPLELELSQAGYTAEWFVAPATFNMPQQVMVDRQGDLLVMAVRSGKLFKVSRDGEASLLAKDVRGYLGDVDNSSRVYLYDPPGGLVMRVMPDGRFSKVAESKQLHSPCNSGFGIGPDGNLYLSVGDCRGVGQLFQVTPLGKITRLDKGPVFQSLRRNPDGRFLGLTENDAQIYRLSIPTGKLQPVTQIPEVSNPSPGGMAFDEAGNIYIATGARQNRGYLYQLDTAGKVKLLAKIPDNGLSGIAWDAQSSEIVGAQLRTGGLVAVNLQGQVRQIIAGNGLNSPMGMAFSPCGELAVANDDAGAMVLVDPSGAARWFMDYLSFTPPVPYVAFAPDGSMYVSEAEPMPDTPKRIAIVPPGGELKELAPGDFPSGVAWRSDGAVLMAETAAGRISIIQPDGAVSLLAENLSYPQALAFDSQDNLYVVTGTAGWKPFGTFNTPLQGDTLLRITPDGQVSTIAKPGMVTALAVSPADELFFGTEGGVGQIEKDGTSQVFLSGLESPMGLAFDLAGNLYISDAKQSAIARIAGFPQGVLDGAVTDSAGKPVPGARIQVLAQTPAVVGLVVYSQPDGSFSLPAAPREYSLSIKASGFQAIEIPQVMVSSQQTTTLMISLSQ